MCLCSALHRTDSGVPRRHSPQAASRIAPVSPWLAGGGNSASALFGLNYLALALSLLIGMLLFRFDLARRWVGRHFQHEVFQYLFWALPLLVLIASVAIMLQAMF